MILIYVQLWQNAAGTWYFHVRAANHEVIVRSTDGYNSKQSAQHGIDILKAGMRTAPVYEA